MHYMRLEGGGPKLKNFKFKISINPHVILRGTIPGHYTQNLEKIQSKLREDMQFFLWFGKNSPETQKKIAQNPKLKILTIAHVMFWGTTRGRFCESLVKIRSKLRDQKIKNSPNTHVMFWGTTQERFCESLKKIRSKLREEMRFEIVSTAHGALRRTTDKKWEIIHRNVENMVFEIQNPTSHTEIQNPTSHMSWPLKSHSPDILTSKIPLPTSCVTSPQILKLNMMKMHPGLEHFFSHAISPKPEI